MEAELSQAAQKGGTKGEKKAQKRMSLNTGRIRSNADAELDIVAWINDLRSDSISARVSTAMINHRALELNPNVLGERPAPSDLAGSIRYRKRKTAWCMRFLKRYRYSVRAVTRQGQKIPAGWPETAMKAIKEWRGMRYDVPSALEVADGVECLRVGTAAGDHEGGRDDGSEHGVPSEPRFKFSLAQTANTDETPVWFEAAGKSTVLVSTGFVDLWIFFLLRSTACPPVARPSFCCCV